MTRLSAIDWIAIALVVIGAINWLLVGLFSFDLVAFLFGGVQPVASLIYIVIGLAGLWLLYTAARLSTPSRVIP